MPKKDMSPMLMPPDLRDWLPENHIARFLVELVEQLGVRSFTVNDRGTGDAQYPPSMLCALLVYCYATGRFASRRIEELVRKAEEADSTPLEDGLTIPHEICRRQERMEKLRQARAEIEAHYEQELAPTVEAVDAAVRAPSHVLADSGYASAQQVEAVENDGGPTVYVATEKTGHCAPTLHHSSIPPFHGTAVKRKGDRS